MLTNLVLSVYVVMNIVLSGPGIVASPTDISTTKIARTPRVVCHKSGKCEIRSCTEPRGSKFYIGSDFVPHSASI